MRNCNIIFILMLSLIITSCAVGGYWNNVDVNLSINPNNPTPGSDITVKCSNYDLFDYGTIEWNVTDNYDESSFYNDCIMLYQNRYYDNQFEYSSTMTEGSIFKEKKSNREAVFTLYSNVVSSCISDGVTRKSTADGCDKSKMLFDNLKYSPSFIHISYPATLTLDKTSAKTGETITVTSSKAFFDTETFSEDKSKRVANNGYNIVWYSAKAVIPDGYVYYPNHNPDKKPIPKDNIDFDSLTPTSVTFTIPSDAITGTIHVINEGGFVVDGTNDIELVGNVANAPAYYSTATELTITK